METDPKKLATFKKDLEEKRYDQAVQALEWKAVEKKAKENNAGQPRATAEIKAAANNYKKSHKKTGKELWMVVKAKIDKNPDFATERKLRNAVWNLRKKGTDPITLTELDEKEKKLVEARQRLEAERDAKKKASEAAAPFVNPLYVKERRLRYAVCNLRKKGTDPTTLAELEKKEKKLVEVRQRLKAEKKAKREALDEADPDKQAVKNRKSCREYVAERKKRKKAIEEKKILEEKELENVAETLMRVRERNYIPLFVENEEKGDNDIETIEDTSKQTIEEEVKNE
jgi:hypothetical protein